MLTPMHRFNPALGVRSGSYWSSKGSDDQARGRQAIILLDICGD